ncbi:MAG: hypothetical protein G01um101430_286 [Parcubacteria group bacterium Gr01-1014_30]|nr:MAG: hypothetical protein G01um101430_286 [Parcubacteria group bacterium Gr01-1014_30]
MQFIENVNLLLYLYPLGSWIFLAAIDSLAGFFLGYHGARRLFKELYQKNKKIAFGASALWYAVLFLYFSTVSKAIIETVLPFLGVSQDLLERLKFAPENWHGYGIWALFVLAGLARLALRAKRASIAQETIQLHWLKAAWRGTKIWLLVAALSFVLMIFLRIPVVLETDRTKEQIEKIRATKLTVDDVMGVNLPIPPDPELKDATIAGFDSNRNGIRDDVELAIFEAYPDSARTRAALLQYALALQTQMTLEVVNEETFVATIEELEEKAHNCILDLFPRGDLDNLEEYLAKINNLTDLVENLQYNTEQRKQKIHDLYEQNLDSFSGSIESCAIDPSSLPN